MLRHGKGIKVQRDQIEDLNGTGLNILADWSSMIGNEMAYYPQRLAAQLILNGAASDGTAKCYDGKAFFAVDHPNNPYNTSAGTYCNWFHSTASGANPGGLPIDDSVTVDVALQNLGKAIATIAGFKMPNGVDPRFLTPKFIMAPPRMAPRLRELLGAKFLAQAAASGGGSADVAALISGWGLGEPIIAQEFAATTSYNFQVATADATTGALGTKAASCSGSDTTYYIVCQELQSTQLGGLLLVNRKPFKVTYYSGDQANSGLDAVLDRANEFEYHVQGRMSTQYGHPYTVFRVDAS